MTSRRSPEKVLNTPEQAEVTIDESNKENIGINQGSPSTARKRLKTVLHDEKADNDGTTDGFSLALVKYNPTVTKTEPTEKRRSRYQRLMTGALSKAHSIQEKAGMLQTRKSKAPKRDIGKLAKLLDAPLDVFCEVASYLQPLDILHLSRTTRGLRVLLMSKQSCLVWKTARDNMKLPECPEDLSEPQYAQLVFGKECDACGAPKVQKVCFELKIRLCKGCTTINIKEGVILANSFGNQYITDVNFYNLVSCDRRNTRKHQFSSPHKRSFLKPDFDDAASMYISLLSDTERCNAFVEERKKITQEAYDFSASIEDWIVNCRKEKKLEEEMNASTRAEQIFKNLRELGYNDEDFKSLNNSYDKHSYEWSRCIEQNRPLTVQIWKTIRPKMEGIILERRAEKRAAELEIRYKKRRLEIAELYLKHLEDIEIPGSGNESLKPGLADVLSFPAAVALIQQNEGQQCITENTWKPLRDALPQIYAETKNQMIIKHFEVLKKARSILNVDTEAGTADDGVDVRIQKQENFLGLASSIFSVRKELAYYPNVLKPRTKEEMEDNMSAVVEDPQRHLWMTRSNFDCLAFNVNTANKFLLALGLPLSTTAAEMYAAGAKYVCRRCDNSVREKFDWLGIVKHFESENYWYSKAKKCLETLKKKKPETTIEVFRDHVFGGSKAPIMKLTASNEHLYEPKNPHSIATLCILCSQLGIEDLDDCGLMTAAEVRAHLKYKHGVKEPEVDTHYKYDVPDSFYDSDSDSDSDDSEWYNSEAEALLLGSMALLLCQAYRTIR